MKYWAIIIAPVVAHMLVTEARACESSVANNPLLNETLVIRCDTKIEKDLSRIEPTASKPRYKKRCWYTNKKGQRRYRMRYAC